MGMFGEKLQLITKQCCVCKKWTALRVDPDDLERHREGLFVQHAFVDRMGRPYLTEDRARSRKLCHNAPKRSCRKNEPGREVFGQSVTARISKGGLSMKWISSNSNMDLTSVG
jgi:hypothetical protein